MSDSNATAICAPLSVLDSSRQPPLMSPIDAAVLGALTAPMPPGSDPPSPPPASPSVMVSLTRGRVSLRPEVLRYLRHQRLLSQQDMADDCWRRNIRLSIATIKRTEGGKDVRFRTARELARYFDVPIEYLLLNSTK